MSATPRARPSRKALVAVLATLVIAACAGDDDAATSSSTSTSAPMPTSADADDTETPEATTTSATSEPVVTTTTTPPTTTGPPATSLVSTTTAPTTTTTTEPLAVQELELHGDGIGGALFGAAPDGVIEYVSSILGSNTADTGWVDPFTFAACDGDKARRVDWGVLSLLFGDLSPYASGREHFIGWEYGRVGQIGDEPVGLRTPGGITLGSRVVDLLAEFPDAGVNEGEDDLQIPPNFYVSDDFRGLLTGTQPDDVVTVMFGGYGCAE